MKRFDITDLPLKGLKRIDRKNIEDERGFFSRLFCTEELFSAGWYKANAQVNHTFTKRRGTVRGMHYQASQFAEMKLVTCIQGKVWDVAVDVREESPNYLKWYAEILSSSNQRSFLIPEGFAHGFQTLTNDATLIYCHSAPHNASFEGGLNPLDPKIDIKWPLPITDISEKDNNRSFISSDFKGVKF
jgi:dTDP-4-dehydrorhamnose 3,5-epimerase